MSITPRPLPVAGSSAPAPTRQVGRRRILAAAAAALVGATALAACSGNGGLPGSGPSFDGEVKLAVAVPLSGNLAGLGLGIADGVTFAANARNAAGGLLGKKVVVKYFDDRASAGSATAVADAVAAWGAPAVIGHFNSSVSIAAAPAYAAKGVLMISPTSTNPNLTKLGLPTVFRVAPTDDNQGPKLASLLVADGRRKPALLRQDGDTSSYAGGLAATLTDALSQQGAPLVATQTYAKDARDWAAQLDAIKAAGPDALVVIGEAPQAAEIVRQARELGLDVPVYGGDSLAKDEFVLRAGRAADGATVTALIPDRVSGAEADKTYVAAFRETFGRNPDRDSPAGTAAADVWFAAVAKAGTTDPSKVAAVMRQPDFSASTMIGPITFTASGDVTKQDFFVNKVSGGHFVAR